VPASSPVDLLDLDDGASPPVAPISQSPSPSAPSGDMLLLDMVRSPEISGLTTKGKKDTARGIHHLKILSHFK
jgi:hypothetical protein